MHSRTLEVLRPLGVTPTLLARAESLNEGARSVHPMVASAYRRRAADLAKKIGDRK